MKMVRDAHELFGGCFDLDLIATLVFTIVEASNKAWIEKLGPQLTKLTENLSSSLRRVNHSATPVAHNIARDVERDLNVMEVNELLKWAEQMQFTPGVVHGDRRKAAGIEMLRQAINVLRGRVSTPQDMPRPFRLVNAGS